MHDSSKSVVDILSATRNLLERPEAWTTGVWARDALGNDIGLGFAIPGRASCWCLSGARMTASLNSSGHDDMASRRLIERAIADCGFSERAMGSLITSTFNDHPSTTHADILAVLDRAIELAKAEEGKPA